MSTYIKSIEYYVPEKVLTNESLNNDFPDWSIDKIYKKTGIKERRVSAENQTASDMAVSAATKLFENEPELKSKVDYIILCTQSPDYALPTTACIIQHKLGLNTSIGAIDVNQGCTGFVYSLGLANGLIISEQAENVLVLTADTYTKYIHPKDKSVRTLFGDGAAAVLVSNTENENKKIHSFSYSTDGAGANNLIVQDGGARNPFSEGSHIERTDSSGNIRTDSHLYMNGGDVFTFTLKAVKVQIEKTLTKSGLTLDDIDHFVFHQPNKFMLKQIGLVCQIPNNKLHQNYEMIGNTVSSTIPILLKDLINSKQLNQGDKILICGFGVGYSAAAAIIEW